jgi:hypothetical protein
LVAVSGIAGFRLQETPKARLSFKRHRFLPDVIRHAVWLYFRFTLSFRDVEELLAQRGIRVSYETVRCPQPTFRRISPSHAEYGFGPTPTPS